MKYKQVFIDTIAYELAPIVVSSDELEERLSPIYQTLKIQAGQLEYLTGIYERRFWEKGFKVSQGAAIAAENALSKVDISPNAIECLIFAGVCRDEFEPATACHVAAALEKKNLAINPDAVIYDLSNACLGVLNGMLEIANRIELGQISAGMVVSCESSREIVDIMIANMNKQHSMELFKMSLATLTGGSGAVAIILTDGSFDSQRRRLVGGIIKNEPRFHNLCRWGYRELPKSNREHYQQFMSTDSVAVLENGVQLGINTWNALQLELGWNITNIDRYISHQVGSGHRGAILKSLGIDKNKDFIAYEFLGNIGTVALPMAAALAEERNFLKFNQRVAFLGIGSGLNCIMLGIEW
jgi:3-oxoacyl-[acyl-carrier-protein] synthase-3